MKVKLNILIVVLVVFIALGSAVAVSANIITQSLPTGVEVFYYDINDQGHYWSITNIPFGYDCSYSIRKYSREMHMQEITGYNLPNAGYLPETSPPSWDAIPARTCIVGVMYIDSGPNKNILHFNRNPIMLIPDWGLNANGGETIRTLGGGGPYPYP